MSLLSLRVFSSEARKCAVDSHSAPPHFTDNSPCAFASVLFLILLFAGILFSDEEGPRQFKNWEVSVVILVCFFLFGALALVSVMVILDIRKEETMKRVARQLQQDMQKVSAFSIFTFCK